MFFVQGVIVLERTEDADFCYPHHLLRCLFMALAGRFMCCVVGEDPLQVCIALQQQSGFCAQVCELLYVQ